MFKGVRDVKHRQVIGLDGEGVLLNRSLLDYRRKKEAASWLAVALHRRDIPFRNGA